MSLFKALQIIQSKGGATVPSIATKFRVSQSTADNWMRRGVDRGLLKANRPKPGESLGRKGTVGRPAVTYTLTAKGAKALEAGEIPGGDRSGYRMGATKTSRKAKGKAKGKSKRKTKAPKVKGRRSLTEAQREAKRARDRKRRAAKAKTLPAPAAEAVAAEAVAAEAVAAEAVA